MLPERKTESELIPLKFHLSQNYPNPFKERTTIKYCLAYRTDVDIIIFDSEGREVKKLLSSRQDAGTYEIEFLAEMLESGIYIYQITAGDFQSTRLMTLGI